MPFARVVKAGIVSSRPGEAVVNVLIEPLDLAGC
jgi:hypothetical protein